MFNTAGVRSIRRFFSALSIVSLAALLGACAHSPSEDRDSKKSGAEKAESLKENGEPSPPSGRTAHWVVGPYSDIGFTATCPNQNLMMVGRHHEGRYGVGKTWFGCDRLFYLTKSVDKDAEVWTAWAPDIFYCPADSVLQSVEQKGVLMRAKCVTMKGYDWQNYEFPVKVEHAGTYGSFDEGGHQFECPKNQAIIGSRAVGPSNEFRYYDCGSIGR